MALQKGAASPILLGYQADISTIATAGYRMPIVNMSA